jgi:hypothetical protein
METIKNLEPIIDRDTADARALCANKAAQMWEGFTKSEKTCVRFGMFPADKMAQAERDGFGGREGVRLLAVALMDCAKADGGMRA